MFVILLRFADKTRAADHMEGHKVWIQRGFDDGLFLLAGSLQPNAGGAILAQGASRSDVVACVDNDPFVAHGVVTAEIHEISPGRTDPRLSFLVE